MTTQGTASKSPSGSRSDAWTRKAVRELKPYYNAPLEGNPLRLDQNTSLRGPNPAIAKVDPIRLDFTQYPTRDGDRLIAALADFHGIPEECITLGNGGDELFDLLVKAFGDAGTTMATPWPSYGLYQFYAAISGMKFAPIATRGGFAHIDVEAIVAAKPRLTFIANPNNPTGARFAGGEIERLLKAVDGVVLVDEAYIEYAGLKHSFLPRLAEFDNLVILRTFSKVHGLAGLRIGWLAANPDLSRRLRLVKPPFNLNVYSESVAIAALDEQAWIDDGVREVRDERERLARALAALGLRVHPSEANFLLCDVPGDDGAADAGELQGALRARGILARTFSGSEALRRSIRFTVGRRTDSDRLVAALKEIQGAR